MRIGMIHGRTNRQVTQQLWATCQLWGSDSDKAPPKKKPAAKSDSSSDDRRIPDAGQVAGHSAVTWRFSKFSDFRVNLWELLPLKPCVNTFNGGPLIQLQGAVPQCDTTAVRSWRMLLRWSCHGNIQLLREWAAGREWWTITLYAWFLNE